MHRLWAVLSMCCVVTLLCLSSQSVYAQVKNSSDSSESLKRGRNGAEKRVNRRNVKERESGEDFYRVIVENNLFRPLGWQRPNRNPEYALIATWIGTRGTVAKALVMERKSSQLYYVARGEQVGDAIVETIAANQISLKDSNDIVTLKTESMEFLSSSGGSDEKTDEGRDVSTDEERERNERRGQRGARRGAIGENEALREWLRTASPEERRRKLEAIRRERQGGRRGGRARNNDSDEKKDDDVDWEEIKGK